MLIARSIPFQIPYKSEILVLLIRNKFSCRIRRPPAVPKTSVSALAAHCYSNYYEQLTEGQFRVEGAGKAQEELRNDQSSIISLAAM